MQTIKWEHYPQVAQNRATRAFIEELAQVLLRLDGLYGNAAVLIDVLKAGLGVIAQQFP